MHKTQSDAGASPETMDLLAMLDQLIKDIERFDPVCVYFLKMCKQALIEAEQKKRLMN